MEQNVQPTERNVTAANLESINNKTIGQPINLILPALAAPRTPNKQLFTVKTIKLSKTDERDDNDSVIRAAMRIAARQGLEAMIELYEKKEPNFMRRGEHLIEFPVYKR